MSLNSCLMVLNVFVVSGLVFKSCNLSLLMTYRLSMSCLLGHFGVTGFEYACFVIDLCPVCDAPSLLALSETLLSHALHYLQLFLHRLMLYCYQYV